MSQILLLQMKKFFTVYCISIFFILIGTCYAASNDERMIRLEKKIRELEQRIKILEGKGVNEKNEAKGCHSQVKYPKNRF